MMTKREKVLTVGGDTEGVLLESRLNEGIVGYLIPQASVAFRIKTRNGLRWGQADAPTNYERKTQVNTTNPR